MALKYRIAKPSDWIIMQVTTQAGKAIQQVNEYDVFLDVDFDGLRFSGKVRIDISSTGDISLDAVDLEVASVKTNDRNVPFKQHGNVVDIQTGRISGLLEVEYSGKVSESLTGFYKAPYGENYVLSTHFEAAHARRLLPCVDHPAYKADFKLTVRTRSDLSVISNMPLESEKKEGNKKIISFQKTPKMSTYLLYLGIGKFEEDTSRHNKTELYAASVVRPDGKIKTGLAFEAAQKSLEFYEKYFGIPYDLPKLHMIAVPEFAYGAMENWGAITFREILLHADKDTSTSTKKSIAEVIAHEIADMWFGDLVTMKWWDDLWLNESFATFMAYKVVDWAYPQWKIWQDFVKNSTGGAMARDALKNTHPIEAKVKSPEEIEELFDEISYGKGASILRMIEAYIGPDKFQKGVSKYLQQFRYSNATGRDLWNHLQQASGLDVNRIMEAWISKPGFPIITATLSDKKLNLEQERFLMAGGIEKQSWPVPVTMMVDGKPQSLLLDKEEAQVNIGPSPKSLKLNLDQTGFYIVHYQGRELQDLLWKSRLSPLDKWGLISDAKALLLSGRMPIREYLSLLERFRKDEEYLPMFEISDQLELLHVLAPEKMRDNSRRFDTDQLKTLQAKTDENSMMLKGIVAGRLTLIDDAYAKEQGSKIKDLASVDPDMKRPVVMGYARSSNDYNGLIDRFKKSATDEERLRYLEGLASFNKPDLVAKALEFSLSGQVKKQDVRNIVAYSTSNADARSVTWEWFKTNIEKLEKMYEGTAQLSSIMRAYISIVGVGHVDEAESLFNRYPVPAADATLERLRIYDRLARGIMAMP